jgi:hypothetical protein
MVGPDGLSHGTGGAPRIGAAMQARPRHRHRFRHHQSPTARLIPLLEELACRLQHPAPAAESPPCETADQAVQCNLLRPPPLPGPVPVQQVYPTGQGRGFNLLRVMNGYHRPPPPPGQVQSRRPPEPFVTQMQRLSIAPAYAASAPQTLGLSAATGAIRRRNVGLIETLCFTYIINVTSSYNILLRVCYLKQSTFQFGCGGNTETVICVLKMFMPNGTTVNLHIHARIAS